jgi:hypothetical protein
MKAALRVVSACVNVMLFLLSSSNAARLLVLLTTLGAWWWLSDYYFAPWPWWMDRYAFILCSFLVLVALSAAVFWFGVRRPARRLAPSFDVFSGKASNTRLEISNWSEILRTIAGLRKGLWARYWTWYRLRLEKLGRGQLPVRGGSLRTVWWFHPSAFPQWLGSLLPACPLGFAAPGPPTYQCDGADRNNRQHPAAGHLRRAMCRSNKILAPGPVVNHSLPERPDADEGVSRVTPVRETLDRGSSSFQRTGRCAFLADGSFEVSSTPFPRVYRRLVLNCRERCDLIPRDGAAALLTDSVPVISGEASFKWLQTSPDPSLGMTISLVRQDGTMIDKVFIEP